MLPDILNAAELSEDPRIGPLTLCFSVIEDTVRPFLYEKEIPYERAYWHSRGLCVDFKNKYDYAAARLAFEGSAVFISSDLDGAPILAGKTQDATWAQMPDLRMTARNTSKSRFMLELDEEVA